MIDIVDKHLCVGCGNCAQVCPQSCISFRADSEGFHYPIADKSRCLRCDTCVRVCPIFVKTPKPSYDRPIQVFGAINKDPDILVNSTSGGVFSALGMTILAQNGIVFGVIQDENNIIKHISIRSPKELAKLRGSKYVQSFLSDTFSQIRSNLDKGVRVLFSGTPCQVLALYAFLGSRPAGLVTVEVICHGVTSPLFYETYLKETGAVSFSFRDKSRSWQDYDVKAQKRGGRVIKQKASYNLFMKGYLQNWMLRPSCYQCPAKLRKSGADLTIGDFWGVRSILPFFFDKKGVSLVLLHTDTSAILWNEASPMLDCCEVHDDRYLAFNPAFQQTSACPQDRDAFMAAVQSKGLCIALKRFTRLPLQTRVKENGLRIWNGFLAIGLGIRDFYYNATDTLRCLRYPVPDVKSIQETLDHIIATRCSVSRFGDGEMKLIRRIPTSFQDPDAVLSQKLQDILLNRDENLIVCIPPVFGEMAQLLPRDKEYWTDNIRRNRHIWYRCMDLSKQYYNAFVSRCYMPYRDKSTASICFDKWKIVWRGRNVLLVEGEKTRFGVGNDLLSGARSVERILGPNTQAFRFYDRFIQEIRKFNTDYLVLLALGPVATIMAAELATFGYQAIDIGHLDIEYEWFLTGAMHKIPVKDKYVNEAGAGAYATDISDRSYNDQVVCRI